MRGRRPPRTPTPPNPGRHRQTIATTIHNSAIGFSKPWCYAPDDSSLLVVYWSGVGEVSPDAQANPPTKSRLMHGASIRAMGRLMDRIMPVINLREKSAKADMIKKLKRVSPLCRWTSGRWEDMGNIKWNDILHVPRHINILSNVLIRAHVQSKGKQ